MDPIQNWFNQLKDNDNLICWCSFIKIMRDKPTGVTNECALRVNKIPYGEFMTDDKNFSTKKIFDKYAKQDYYGEKEADKMSLTEFRQMIKDFGGYNDCIPRA